MARLLLLHDLFVNTDSSSLELKPRLQFTSVHLIIYFFLGQSQATNIHILPAGQAHRPRRHAHRRTLTCTLACTLTLCTHRCTHSPTHTRMHTCTHFYTHSHICIHTCAHPHPHMCNHFYTYRYAPARVHTHSPTPTHMHTVFALRYTLTLYMCARTHSAIHKFRHTPQPWDRKMNMAAGPVERPGQAGE